MFKETNIFCCISCKFQSTCNCDSIALNMILKLPKTVLRYFLFKFIELNHLWIMSKQTNIFITNPDFTGATDNNIPESNQGMD